MKAIVHIGNMKTGTTSIQDFLYKNNDYLKLHGYYYPRTTQIYDHQHGDIVYMLMECHKNHIEQNYEKYFLTTKFNKVFSELKNEIVLNSRYIQLFSSEGFFCESYNLSFVKSIYNFFKELGFIDIDIICYIKSQDLLLKSLASQDVKGFHGFLSYLYEPQDHPLKHLFDYKKILQFYIDIFSKDNIYVRLFDKAEFYMNDLFRDFFMLLNIPWSDNLLIPKYKNCSLNLLGFKLLDKINKYDIFFIKNRFEDIIYFVDKYFTEKGELEFKPPKKIIGVYIDYFEESNEWVRKEFFPRKERLFPKKDLTNYKENYELKEMKPEYWDKIAEFIADIIKTKNQSIVDKEHIIQNLNNTLNKTIKEKDDIINSNINHINQLQSGIQEKLTQLNQTQSKLSFQTKHSTAKARIQNQLSYKLGQAMIINSKSILGYIRMPFVLSYIKDKHKQEQKIHQEKIKKDPSLKLPPLEDYPDYKEALKEKECLTYKVGEALIKANKTWYKGGYIKLLFEIRKLKRKFKEKVNHV
ncbi:hypothetical protein O8I41_05650 [Campylobacter lari]|uniref:hypothetical protein n=1 Tax=Campylobacter lari TaxID=201 RepID=UPI00372A34CE